MKVLRLSAQDTYPIRQQVLIPDHDIKKAKFENDEDEDISFHLGAFKDSKLVSVASFYYERNPIFQDQHQYQLRGMATLPEFQGQGLSSELLTMAFPIIKQNFCTLLWCNARTTAVGFYEKVGFKKLNEEVFEIEGIGPHVLMYKNI
ncbi:GNAT family N-acetyltransferase [Bacteriovorax stolpii]|uniref:N-acetyltransferase n=1 Tax=Bacteriovorax stolpii TaxID=960 RepID=A0A2K9NR22_BACTC|nr:GNAT family N-acetyltransferase [Bacteriovorax stolpii]AUN97951.1 N-acetyltransferase [Bacteriovorax stolpii]QDK42063.1 GNAT family N-acetyltransferase [Bacteriovorax stolpii]TDP51784.1 acetyltransferase (GNAT) family protein [Bacteriovorax stolpii]